MTSIKCAALECVNNKDCLCSCKSLRLFKDHDHLMRCSDYAPDEEYLRLWALVARNPKLSRNRMEDT